MILAIVADHFRLRRLLFVCKPLTTVLILMVAALASESMGPWHKWLVVAGLAASVLGDIFLMFEESHFVAGLASFLVAHVLYTCAFVSGATGLQWTASAWTGVAVIGVLLAILLPRTGALKWPVAVYAMAIGVMLLAAVAQSQTPWSERAPWALAGAILFVTSDALLALNKFVQPFALNRVLVLGTYFPAQWLIALSAGR
jgi:uncharacterized membrane protein YhhN